MVKEAYGTIGKDLQIGVKVLLKAVFNNEFLSSSGKYYDNDVGVFASPHPDALDDAKCKNVVDTIDEVLNK